MNDTSHIHTPNDGGSDGSQRAEKRVAISVIRKVSVNLYTVCAIVCGGGDLCYGLLFLRLFDGSFARFQSLLSFAIITLVLYCLRF